MNREVAEICPRHCTQMEMTFNMKNCTVADIRTVCILYVQIRFKSRITLKYTLLFAGYKGVIFLSVRGDNYFYVSFTINKK